MRKAAHPSVRGLGRRYFAHCRGSIAIQFALAMVPVAGGMAAAVDYSRATHLKTELQSGIDAAVLAGAKVKGEGWLAAANDAFDANVVWGGVPAVEPTFSMNADGDVTGSLDAVMPTTLLGVIGVASLDLAVEATAGARRVYDNSCILALDQSGDESNDALLLNGAPNVNFNQCTIRSNTSIQCNGHGGGSIASIAVGTVSGCSNPQPGAAPVPDIYENLADDLTTTCGGSRPGKTWTPGNVPAGVTSIDRGSHTEYHVCGNLTLSGSGYLTGDSPPSDSVIIVENGGLNIADSSAIQTKRVAFVLTGNNSFPSSISFPSGSGHASTLSLSPPTSAGNPWRGVSLYQDPALTNGVDNDWGPAATLNPDGVVYLPRSNITLRGNAASSIAGCTKFVANSIRTNGSVNLSFMQSTGGCARLGVEQWYDAAPYLSY